MRWRNERNWCVLLLLPTYQRVTVAPVADKHVRAVLFRVECGHHACLLGSWFLKVDRAVRPLGIQFLVLVQRHSPKPLRRAARRPGQQGEVKS